MPKFEDRIGIIDSDQSDQDDSAKKVDINQVSMMPDNSYSQEISEVVENHQKGQEISGDDNTVEISVEPFKHRLQSKKKPKNKSCSHIFCGDFMKARLQLLRFKISWDYLVKVEKHIAPKIFFVLALQILVYFSIGMILPFVASFVGKEKCSSVSPFFVY